MKGGGALRGTRRRLLLGTLIAFFLGAAAVAPFAGALDPVTEGTDERVVLDSGRSYVLHTPPALRQQPRLAEGRPALVVLHALETDPADAADSTGFSRLSDRDGVLVAYPFGLRRSFNAGLCCGESVTQGVDDVSFLADVVADLRARGAHRVSVVGFSNGGMMAYRLACERPGLIDTVGVMSGTLEIPRCAGPIRALHLHGDSDTAVPFTGQRWSERLQCFLRDVRTIGAAAPGSSITVRKLTRFPHRWTEPGDAVDATAEFWTFARMG
ncbi:MAG TPA: PHB depolymerase family esterase [Mycobacteriales bacterium]|nr:PHB depolymerase family esterase [Mycobacteriales bacterium]